MDNIIITKTLHDDNLIQLNIKVFSQYVNIWQDCFIEDKDLIENANKMLAYTKFPNENCYVEFGVKKGNFTPAYSINLLPIDSNGKVKIELDMEINDNNKRMHRCSFYICTEIGLIEKLAKNLKTIVNKNTNETISLVDSEEYLGY